MTNSNSGRVGVVVGTLILCGGLAGCVDNGNDVGFEEMPDGGSSPNGDAAVVNTAIGGSGGSGGDSGAHSNVATTASGGSGTGGGPAETSGVGGSASGGPAETSGVGGSASGVGGGPAETSSGDSGGTTGAGGSPAETTPCGPEELELNCESDEICRGVQGFGPVEYSCQPNPCFEHDQANSCECAASLCGSDAPNCVMLEDDTVLACVCVFC